MDEKKQMFEDMAEAILEDYARAYSQVDKESLATYIRTMYDKYNAGYRKQSEGEWVQLPCKVGDTLYVISQTKDKRILPFISTYEATSINVGKRKCIVYHEMDGYIKLFKQDDFGKTVFLTKEEAEQAVTDIRVGSN